MSTSKELIQAQNEELQVLRQMVEDLRTELREGKTQVDRDMIDEAIAVLNDPYDVQSPFRIIGDIPPDDEFPEGQKLRWISPRYRDVRGRRGWIALQWGDKYTGDKGEKLKGLIPDPPQRFEESGKLDSYVRRGDVILARLDKRIWEARQAKRELEDARRKGRLEQNQTIKLREGVYLTGEGLKKDPNPKSVQRPSGPDKEFDPDTGTGTHRTQLMEQDG